ncbi:MAG: hypothetical protein LBF97_00150 [Elusimicrobiota bacterium]|jgi:hypothetical protein|nr:hypothetical protein [Elusimicrobiota bacterium]
MLMIDYSKVNYYDMRDYSRILKEAYTNIKSVEGNRAVLNLKAFYDNLKKYNPNDEENTLKDITDYALYVITKIKPESAGYVKRFKKTGRKIYLAKNISETSFVSYTEEEKNGKMIKKDLIMNIRLLGTLEHFSHEFTHIVQYVEIFSKYQLGVDFKIRTLEKPPKDIENAKDLVAYMLRYDEFEKNISHYISEMHNKNYKSTGNYRKILIKIFSEPLNEFFHLKNEAVSLMLNKPSLRIKILKRLYREGIKVLN